MKLRGIDLNLLVTVDALLDEAHVGRAAARVGLSQPAASNALGRARALFGDRLLVRSPSGGLRRTPRAEAMREPLRAALADLAAIVGPAPPALADLRGAIRLVAPDVPGAALGGALGALLARRAPGIDLIFHPWRAGDEVERLERGGVDLVLTVPAFFGASLRAEAFGDFPYAVTMRRGHPAAVGAFDLERWLAFPHVIVSGHGDRQGSVDAALARIGRRRRVSAVVPSFLQALELLRRTDLLGAFPSAVMARCAADHLLTRPIPVPLEPVSLHLVRHRRTDADAAVTFVAEMIGEVAPQLGGQLAEELASSPSSTTTVDHET